MTSRYLQWRIFRLDGNPISRQINQIHRLAPLKSQMHSRDPPNTSIFSPVFIIVIDQITGFETKTHTRLHLLTYFKKRKKKKEKKKNYSEIYKSTLH